MLKLLVLQLDVAFVRRLLALRRLMLGTLVAICLQVFIKATLLDAPALSPLKSKGTHCTCLKQFFCRQTTASMERHLYKCTASPEGVFFPG